MSDKSGSSRRSLERTGSRRERRKTKPKPRVEHLLPSDSEGSVESQASLRIIKVLDSSSSLKITKSTMSEINLKSVSDAFEALSTSTANRTEFNEAINHFLDSCKGKLNDWINSTISFAGFDAAIMRSRVMKKASPQQIVLLIAVGLVRGNNVDRISKTMTDSGTIKKFNEPVKVLSVVKAVGGNFNAITLSRLIACFPEVVCRILHDNQIPMAVTYDEIQFVHLEYPKIARHQVCASIISSDLNSEDLDRALDVIIVPYLMISEVINSRNKDWTKQSKKARAETSSMYLHNSYNSKLLDAKERRELSISLGIMNKDSKLTATWMSASSSARNWLQDNYRFYHGQD
ncbi:unnamed protein product [Chrysodeixis includens]|uniref:Uncharacterized protein n=1 Tax=Chrysodeixis includens TaxID=689277 RepID=A0A9N8Q2Z5_CHRIL|nr:unnamed protein product [Chrysodeixis includens]